MWQTEIPDKASALGYKRLVDVYQVKTLPHFCWSYASPKWEKRAIRFDDQNLTIYIYPPSQNLTDNVFEHLEFALKYEGINLAILKQVLLEIPPNLMNEYVSSKPTGKYARVLWYLYENFHQKQLPRPDLKQGTYTPILDPKEYYTSKGNRSSRHRVSDNLLGAVHFSPLVRKTPILRDYEKKQLGEMAHELTKNYDQATLARAMRYLYTKETMSSWEIEREKPDNAKLAKFVGLLHKADSIGNLTEQVLVNLQKGIVDPRFALNAYRNFQNYVGEEPGLDQLILHYIAPKPTDVPNLMNNLIHSLQIMETSGVNPVIAAAILSFGFVFIHPFEDGNGRIHRFLIHYVLARLGFTPEGIVFPISAAIARDTQRYDKTLEAFSKPLLEVIPDYKVNNIGEMEVLQDTKDYYSYIDFTPMAEFLFECVNKTITTDFQEELTFLADYDSIKRLCKEVVDMPDQRIDLFIKCVRQNGGELSTRKRETHFKMLSNEEVKKMETIINKHSNRELSPSTAVSRLKQPN